MFLANFLAWWYGAGLVKRLSLAKKRLIHTADLFSISQLIRTIFNPFKMTSANDFGGPSLKSKIDAWFGRLLSRIIGAIARIIMILVGIVVLILELVWSGLMLIMWLLVPLVPVAGIMLAILKLELV